MFSQDAFRRVQATLRTVEQKYNLRVLYACESGSRAWGFASQDSDYDVRFIYVHRQDWYLSVQERRDVFELPLTRDLDVSGWELRKALRLLQKSNPPLLEWLRSPVVYRRDPAFVPDFKTLAEQFYSPRRCFLHYLHMGYGNYRDYLQGREQVSLKKYLYVFRPLLACRWIEQGLGPVPMLFQQLVDHVLDTRWELHVREELAALVTSKRSGDELALAPANPVLSQFIETELKRLDALAPPRETAGNAEELDLFFRRYCVAA